MSELTIQDIILMEQIIRVGQSRGAFQVQEMVEIGTFYKKIIHIIEKAKEESNDKEKLSIIQE